MTDTVGVDHGVFVDGEGKVSRDTVISWPVIPEDLGEVDSPV